MTLLELLMVVAITAVFATLAVPSMVELANNARVTTTVNRFMAGLRLARSEAIRTGQRATLCALGNDGRCTVAGLGDGWAVAAGDDPYAPDARIIQVFDSVPTFLQVDYRFGSGAAEYISYVPTGETRRLTGGMLMGSVRFCDSRNGRHDRRIIVSASGRPRVEHRSCDD